MGALGARPCSCESILGSGMWDRGMPKPLFTHGSG